MCRICQGERYWLQADACTGKIQEDLYAKAPVVGRLPGIKEVKVKTISVGKHHDMCCPPYMGHRSAIVFHFVYLHALSESGVILSMNER